MRARVGVGVVAALLVVVPVAVGDALAPLVDSMRALARARGSAARLEALLDQEPAVSDPVSAPATPADVRQVGASSSQGAGRNAVTGRHVSLEQVAASWTGTGDQLAPTDSDESNCPSISPILKVTPNAGAARVEARLTASGSFARRQ